MEKKIESYNASYPAAYYEIGTVYAFYSNVSVIGTPASEQQIQKFSFGLRRLEARQSTNAIQPVKGGLLDEPPLKKGGLTRYYAVVIEKNTENIKVMFLNKDGVKESFLTKKYTVNGSAKTDGKDLMDPMTHTNITGIKEVGKRVGGITRSEAEEKVGRITKAGNMLINSAGIGGITRTNKNQNLSSIVTEKVGGITKMKK